MNQKPPEKGDKIEIIWYDNNISEIVIVSDVTEYSIFINHINGNRQTEEIHFDDDDGLPFDWQLISANNNINNYGYNNNNNNNNNNIDDDDDLYENNNNTDDDDLYENNDDDNADDDDDLYENNNNNDGDLYEDNNDDNLYEDNNDDNLDENNNNDDLYEDNNDGELYENNNNNNKNWNGNNNDRYNNNNNNNNNSYNNNNYGNNYNNYNNNNNNENMWENSAPKARYSPKKAEPPKKTRVIARTISDTIGNDNNQNISNNNKYNNNKYNSNKYNNNYSNNNYGNNNNNNNYEPGSVGWQQRDKKPYQPKPKLPLDELPLPGDILLLTYKDGKTINAKVKYSNYSGSCEIEYLDKDGGSESINIFVQDQFKFKITKSPYKDDFIPLPNVGDKIEIKWKYGQGRDIATVKDINIEQNMEYKYDESNIYHYKKYKKLQVSIVYITNPELETIDFMPNANDQDILSYKILENDKQNFYNNKDEMPGNDDEYCALCATSFNEFPYKIIVPCNDDNVCAKCALKMRWFVDENKNDKPVCPFCQKSWEHIVFVDYKYKINKWDNIFKTKLEYDDEINVFFSNTDVLKHFIHIRSIYCVLCYKNNPNNRVKYYYDIEKLLGHMKYDHNSFMCRLCISNSKMFINEQRVFKSNQELFEHEKFGSKQDKTLNLPETEMHPYCFLCKRRFYNKDTLWDHCQTDHYRCHFCHAIGILEFYKDIKVLEEHYRQNHYLCEDPNCLKMEYIVFNDPVSLQNHNLSYHNKRTAPAKANSMLMTSFYVDNSKKHCYDPNASFKRNNIMQWKFDEYRNRVMNDDELKLERVRQKREIERMEQRLYGSNHRQKTVNPSNLRSIPDKVLPKNENEKSNEVLLMVKQQLGSNRSMQQFANITKQFNKQMITEQQFFNKFKTLFVSQQTNEQIWVDILMKMIALLKDPKDANGNDNDTGKRRRALYEVYKQWVQNGKDGVIGRRNVNRRNVTRGGFNGRRGRTMADMVGSNNKKKTSKFTAKLSRSNSDLKTKSKRVRKRTKKSSNESSDNVTNKTKVALPKVRSEPVKPIIDYNKIKPLNDKDYNPTGKQANTIKGAWKKGSSSIKHKRRTKVNASKKKLLKFPMLNIKRKKLNFLHWNLQKMKCLHQGIMSIIWKLIRVIKRKRNKRKNTENQRKKVKILMIHQSQIKFNHQKYKKHQKK